MPIPQPEAEKKPASVMDTLDKSDAEESRTKPEAVQPKREIKVSSKWEELDSLISAQRSSQQQIDAYKPKPATSEPVQSILDQETKDALINAVDNIDSILESSDSSVKESSWDDEKIEKTEKTEKPDQVGVGEISESKVEAFPTESRWGDLDAVTDEVIESAKKEEQKSKWGDLDSIPSPGQAAKADVEPIKASSSKWGDLDSIPSPGQSSSGNLDSYASSSSPSSSLGPGGSIFGDIAGLDEAKLDNDPASPSGLTSAKWGDEVGSSEGFGSRTGKLGRTTGSFSKLQSDPNEKLVSADSVGSGEGDKDQEVVERPKAMPIPQAQAPNKWQGSVAGGASTAVSSSLKAIDGKKQKPIIQKPEVKVSLKFNWSILSYLVASIAAILVGFLSFTFYMY